MNPSWLPPAFVFSFTSLWCSIYSLIIFNYINLRGTLNSRRHVCHELLCFLWHRTCSQLWSKDRLVPHTRTVCSCLTSSCPTSTQLCRLCFATCRSAAAASIPTSMTTARSASVCWGPGLERWVCFVGTGIMWCRLRFGPGWIILLLCFYHRNWVYLGISLEYWTWNFEHLL